MVYSARAASRDAPTEGSRRSVRTWPPLLITTTYSTAGGPGSGAGDGVGDSPRRTGVPCWGALVGVAGGVRGKPRGEFSKAKTAAASAPSTQATAPTVQRTRT